MKRIGFLAGAAALSILLTGCKPSDMADANVLAAAREYFPLADVVHPPAAGSLQVSTHVDNVSEKFWAKVMAQMLTEHQSELQFLPFVGYSSLAVSFKNGVCSWHTDWQFFRCRYFGEKDARDYTFYGTPVVNDFTPPMPPPLPPAPYNSFDPQ